MDIGKSFTFMFQDPDSLRKLGIGTLVMLVGIFLAPVLIGIIPLIIVTGYTLDVTRNVLDGRTNPLPEWEDWGGFLSRGAKLFVVFLVLSLPIIITMIPFFIGTAFTDNRGDLEAIGALFVTCGVCLTILYSLLLTVISPAVYVAVARTDRISAGLDISRIWAFTRDNISNVIVAVLLILVASLVATIIAGLGIIAIFIGLIVTIPFASFWQMLVQAHLFGQVGANSVTSVV